MRIGKIVYVERKDQSMYGKSSTCAGSDIVERVRQTQVEGSKNPPFSITEES
ncbi:hypothetical protein AAJCM20276_09570 [Acetobacter aceti]|uniref:Uncharacterized protein n=1 Tax=Acetobacter aceti TaxID=435 RepID=A0A6S6PGD6_ACEAC|nr:hypothetical protein AAJCM20276_09570 [Acetobacter aceti]